MLVMSGTYISIRDARVRRKYGDMQEVWGYAGSMGVCRKVWGYAGSMGIYNWQTMRSLQTLDVGYFFFISCVT